MPKNGLFSNLSKKAKLLISGISAGAIVAVGGIIAILTNNSNTADDGQSDTPTEINNPLGVTSRVEKTENNNSEFVIYYTVPINNETKEIIVKYTTEFDEDEGNYILGEYYYQGKQSLAKYTTRKVFRKNYTNISEFTPENVTKYFGVQNFTKIANQDGSGDDIAFYTYEENSDGKLRSAIWIIIYQDDGKVSIKGGYEYLNELKTYGVADGEKPWFHDVMGFCTGRSAECQPRAKIDGSNIYYYFTDYSISHMHCHSLLTQHKEIHNRVWPVGTMNKDRIFDIETYTVLTETDC